MKKKVETEIEVELTAKELAKGFAELNDYLTRKNTQNQKSRN